MNENHMEYSRPPGRLGDYVLYISANYLWALSMELASRHSFDAKNFKVVPRFFKKFGTHRVDLFLLLSYTQFYTEFCYNFNSSSFAQIQLQK